MDSFKAPNLLPADLLLIQSLLGVIEPSSKSQPVASTPGPHIDEEEDNIDSSGSEYASEDEIVDVLMVKEDENNTVTSGSASVSEPAKCSLPYVFS